MLVHVVYLLLFLHIFAYKEESVLHDQFSRNLDNLFKIMFLYKSFQGKGFQLTYLPILEQQTVAFQFPLMYFRLPCYMIMKNNRKLNLLSDETILTMKCVKKKIFTILTDKLDHIASQEFES